MSKEIRTVLINCTHIPGVLKLLLLLGNFLVNLLADLAKFKLGTEDLVLLLLEGGLGLLKSGLKLLLLDLESRNEN